MPRFFVDPAEIGPQFTVLTGENAAHAKVLRLRKGDGVTLCDGQGTDYACTISDISPDQVCLVVHQSAPSVTEPKIFASVYMGFAKGDKLEHVIQKATELGAAEIVAFPCSRCVAKFDEKSLQKKLPRWQKIAASAAEQSGRGRIPEVLTLPSYAAALKRAAEADKAIFFYENEQQHTLSSALKSEFQTISLMTGPEGGFSLEEANRAQEAGMELCTLGTRILRCETAPLCALSAVMFAAGEY
jgi:16S rRNA (uracil1498-N3)-methyltransferase